MTENVDSLPSQARSRSCPRTRRGARTRPTSQWGVGDDAIGLLDGHADRSAEASSLQRGREWRRLVFDSGFGWLGGPLALGGAGRSPQLDEEYRLLEREFDVPDQQPFATGTHLVAPAILANGSEDVQQRFLPGLFRGDLVALSAVERAGGGLRPCGAAHASDARRRRLDRLRAEGVDVTGPSRRCRSAARPDRHGRAEAPRVDDVPRRHAQSGRDGPPAAADDGRDALQRGLPRRRPGPGREPGGTPWERLVGGDGDADGRTRRCRIRCRRTRRSIRSLVSSSWLAISARRTTHAFASGSPPRTPTPSCDGSSCCGCEAAVAAGRPTGPEGSISSCCLPSRADRAANLPAICSERRSRLTPVEWGTFAWAAMGHGRADAAHRRRYR